MLKNKLGTLYLIPTPLAPDSLHCIPDETIRCTKNIDVFIVERAKTARHFLKAMGHPLPINEIRIIEIPKHDGYQLPDYYFHLKNGIDVGLMSEAGTPCIADPGSEIVLGAQRQNMKVKPLVGPSSILLSLMASGIERTKILFSWIFIIQKGTTY